MESHFAHLHKRDTSVSMLRVKMSRRRSQSQKENRERAVNTRRHLDKLPELEMSSLDASVSKPNMSTIQEKTMNSAVVAKSVAGADRMKQLARWKERKALEKEKEKRERERKGVFKTGIYHPKDTFNEVSQFVIPAGTKETKVSSVPSQSTRVTRSMKQQQLQQMQKPLKVQHSNTVARKVEPVIRALATRSANRPPVTAAPVVKDQPKQSADIRITRSKANAAVLPGGERKSKGTLCSTAPPAPPGQAPEMQVPEDKPCPPSPTPGSREEDLVGRARAESVAPVDPVAAQSFAPDGFVFQAPDGLSFKFEPLTPRSADAFLSPNLSFSLPPFPVLQAESSCRSLRPSPTLDPPTPAGRLESKHDVPYFRSEIANETDRLTKLRVHWEARVEDEAIPEEMRDRMRTAVGQARLLMKERFKQFGGLVDDCELGRGEKITTCTDLQGFWDMVYYQVEDVKKKFDALEEAESRDWVEAYKPPPRQKKVAKKPPIAMANTTGTKAAAKSRLAAVKAAVKTRQRAAEKAATVAGDDVGAGANSQEAPPVAESQQTGSVVFDGGFFMVESPAKPTGPLRRSSRLIASVLSPTSPRRVTRRSLAAAQTPVHAAAPSQRRLTLGHTRGSLHATPQSSCHGKDAVNVSLCSPAVKEARSQRILPKEGPECQSERVAALNGPSPMLIAEEQAEAVGFGLHSPSCEMLPVSQAPEILRQSFASSLLVTPTQPPVSTSVGVQESVCATPDSLDVEDIPGLDIERYFQPSQRCSLSLTEMVSEETLSPVAVDVEMKSPSGETQDLCTQQETALPAVSSVLIPESPQVASCLFYVQTATSALLLFTPDLKDRIRQSVCPSDLMVFTPPF
ncbi:disks large-associated protein 5 [Brachionichthys hirsutus]|uniref:disks large-associated protein 5 n=1 Tax=Brachionichthys hirsutus TaxID=412623 RepID=UPI003605206D